MTGHGLDSMASTSHCAQPAAAWGEHSLKGRLQQTHSSLAGGRLPIMFLLVLSLGARSEWYPLLSPLWSEMSIHTDICICTDTHINYPSLEASEMDQLCYKILVKSSPFYGGKSKIFINL